MSNTTTCSDCCNLYEEFSEECANEPHRLCPICRESSKGTTLYAARVNNPKFPLRAFVSTENFPLDRLSLYTDIYGLPPDAEVVKVHVRRAARGEEHLYWAWWDHQKRRFSGFSVWPSRGQTEICFPDGGEVRTARGEGRIVPVIIEIIEVVSCQKAGEKSS